MSADYGRADHYCVFGYGHQTWECGCRCSFCKKAEAVALPRDQKKPPA